MFFFVYGGIGIKENNVCESIKEGKKKYLVNGLINMYQILNESKKFVKYYGEDKEK